MTYAAAIDFLRGLQVFGANFGLETPRKLAALAGNPQETLRFIHVAGTNGKGSTCAMLESIYRASGLRVGLFTSPHLVSFRERIQVNRQLISESDVARFVAESRAGFQPARRARQREHCADSVSAGRLEACPTFFEFVTVLALKYFAEQRCDLVIWETGLGGRLDATNIVIPLASVITNIALDHQQWLGDTLEKIAAEKAGIIKPGVSVITAAEQPEVLAVIERVAQANGARLVKVGQASSLPGERGSASIASASPTRAGETPALPLAGTHQERNAALALATVELLQQQIPVSAEQIRAGLAQVSWPGRLQVIERGRQTFLLDGAHNVAGAEVLRAALLSWSSRFSVFPDKLKFELQPGARTLILGVLGDKDWRGMCEILAPLASRILLVPVSSERTALPAQLAEACRAANPAADVACCDSLPDALAQSAQDGLVVIAGSLYLVGEALTLLDPAFRDVGDERRLNEWGATPAQTASAKTGR